MTTPPLRKEKVKELEDLMSRLGVSEEDIIEQFIRGSGSGGQKINKTSSTVRLRHQPTGLEVRCQSGRSQALNRFMARRRLMDKIAALMEGQKTEDQKRREKIRRQKRKRSKRAKEKMLLQKHQQSEKKSLRRTPSEEDEVT